MQVRVVVHLEVELMRRVGLGRFAKKVQCLALVHVLLAGEDHQIPVLLLLSSEVGCPCFAHDKVRGNLAAKSKGL